MINWIFNNFLWDKDNPPLPTKETASVLLLSIVANDDVITDWLYYNEIIKYDMASCIHCVFLSQDDG